MSLEQQLQAHLQLVSGRQRRLLLLSKLAVCWVVIAVAGLLVLELERLVGWAFSLAVPIFVAAAILSAFFVFRRHSRASPDWRALSRLIEARFPQLDGRLLTAVQQQANSGAELSYLQQRVVEEALQESQRANWTETVPRRRLALAYGAQWSALFLAAFLLWHLPRTHSRALLARISDFSIAVSPGDTSLERGSSLVVVARFHGQVPPGVELVVAPRGAGSPIPLIKSLADPIFGGSIPEVSSNLVYYIQYAGQRTPDFSRHGF